MSHDDKSSTTTPAAPDARPIASVLLENYFAAKLDSVRRLLPLAREQLKSGNVCNVRIDYVGEAGLGRMQDVRFLDGNGRSVEFILGEITKIQLLDVFYDLVESRHAGWQNSDGAFGSFKWDLVTDTLHHTHHTRFRYYKTAEYDGLGRIY